MYCRNCGSELGSGDIFCPVCGIRVTQNNSSGVQNNAPNGLSENSDSDSGRTPFFTWYIYNWKRCIREKWVGVEFKHHALWCLFHAISVLIIVILIISINGIKSETSTDIQAIENLNEDVIAEADSQQEKDTDEEKIDDSVKLQVGQNVFFGKYEQDNVSDNGMEPIEWEVLDVDDEKALLFSKKVLDSKVYMTNDSYTGNWSNSDIRQWLNDEFYGIAFSNEEQNGIITTSLETDRVKTETGDKVFLLSTNEIDYYYSFSHIDRDGSSDWYYSQELIACATPYALRNQDLETQSITMDDYSNLYKDYGYNSEVIGSNGAGWWARSRDADWNMSAWLSIVYVNGAGRLTHYQGKLSSEICGVRPAIWVFLSSLN